MLAEPVFSACCAGGKGVFSPSFLAPMEETWDWKEAERQGSRLFPRGIGGPLWGFGLEVPVKTGC